MSPFPSSTASSASPPPAFKRTLYVGLGGSGAKILTRLKRYFIEHYGQVPACKRFLALDTDAGLPKLDSLVDDKVIQLDPSAEFFHMQVPSPLEYIENSDAREWLNEPVPTQSIIAGTGAVRQVGRLALMAHAHKVFPRIRETFTQLQDINLHTTMKRQGFALLEDGGGQADIEVYICGSVAGGTGSGTFLDVGCFCRHALPERAMIYAVLMGPWIYRNVGATFRTPANAYSALMELDLLMTISVAQHKGLNEGQGYTVRYDREPIIVEHPPFNVVHLVDGQNQDGMSIGNPGELIKFIAEGLFLSTSANIGDHLRSAVDNIMTGIAIGSPQAWNGKHAMYSSFGVGAAVYPAANYVQRATHRYARTMLEAMTASVEGLAALPGDPDARDEQDVGRFVEDAQLDPSAGPAVLDRVCALGDVPGVRLMPPIAPMLGAAYPGSLDGEVRQKISSALGAARDALDDPAQRVAQAVERYIERGSTDPREAVDPTRKATRLQQLHTQLRALVRACDSAAKDAARRAEDEEKAFGTALDAIRGEIDGAGFLTRKARLLASVTASFDKVVTHANQRVRAQLDRERTELLRAALAAAVTRLEVVFGEVAEAQRTGGALGGLVEEALRLYHLRLGDAEQTDLRAGLSNFELEVELPREIPDDERELATQDAGELLQQLAEAGGAVGARRLLEAAIERAGVYARRVFHDEVDVLDLIEQHEAEGEPTSGLLRDTYSGQLASQLARLGQPLWYFDPGQMNQDRAEGYTKVAIYGAPVASGAERLLARHHSADQHKPSFVGTNDRHRITLINFVSALPISALEQVAYYEERYNKLFEPPVHSTRFFQMNAETLIPESKPESLVFSLLGIGIVEGLDLISDEKAKKGEPGRYRLLFDLEADLDHPLRELRPKLGDKFLQAHAYLLRRPFVTRQLLDRTVQRLEELRTQDPARLSALLDAQMAKLEDEVQRRRMNKMLTWRYMRRELELLRRVQLWDKPFDNLFV